jgi:DNA gyrase/topoisomerase IV subunit B
MNAYKIDFPWKFMDKKLGEMYVELRKDIREYFKENLEPEEYYIKKMKNEIKEGVRQERWEELTRHKNNLSKICGINALLGQCDMKQSQMAEAYLIEHLKL